MYDKVKKTSILVFAILILLFLYYYFQPVVKVENDSKVTQTTHPTKDENNDSAIMKPEPKIETPVIANDNLPISKKEPEKQLSSIPQLKLQVMQVFTGGTHAYAKISYEGSPVQNFKESDSLSDGVILKSIIKNGIIVDNHGKLEKFYSKIRLNLPDKNDKGPANYADYDAPPPIDEDMEKMRNRPKHEDFPPPGAAYDMTGPGN